MLTVVFKSSIGAKASLYFCFNITFTQVLISSAALKNSDKDWQFYCCADKLRQVLTPVLYEMVKTDKYRRAPEKTEAFSAIILDDLDIFRVLKKH